MLYCRPCSSSANFPHFLSPTASSTKSIIVYYKQVMFIENHFFVLENRYCREKWMGDHHKRPSVNPSHREPGFDYKTFVNIFTAKTEQLRILFQNHSRCRFPKRLSRPVLSFSEDVLRQICFQHHYRLSSRIQ